MAWHIYIFILFGGALVSGAAAASAWRRPAAAGGRDLALLMGAVFEWCLTATFEAAAASLPVKILWSKVEYLGIASTPVLLFLFALRFTGADARLTRLGRMFLWTVPAATFLLALTNESHRLIWSAFTPLPQAGPRALVYTHGAFFWVHATYSYLLLTATTVLLVRAYLRTRDIQRRQARALILAVPWPWLGNALYLAGLTTASGRDYTPLGFAVTGLVILWGLHSLRLVSLVPVARDKVIESMSESLIVLDDAGRVASLNRAARGFLGIDRDGAAPAPEQPGFTGRPVSEVFAAWPGLAAKLSPPAPGRAELERAVGDESRVYDLEISPVQGRRGVLTGWVAVLHDITQLKRAEKAAVEAVRVAEALREAGANLNQTLELGRMSTMVLDLMRRVISFDAGAFLTAEGAELRLAGIKGIRAPLELIGRTFPIAGCRLCHHVIEQFRPIVFDDIRREDVLIPLPEDFPVHSYLGVPIIHRGRVEGLLALYSAAAGFFKESDLRVAETFANQAGIALVNSRLFDELKGLAVTDTLTGLLNRRRLPELALRETERALRYKRPLSVLFLDIDHFKEVNDRHGHLVGDMVLRALAKRILQATRTTDIVCRYGGEEFVVLIPEAGLGQALATAERLRQVVSDMTVSTAEADINITISLGVAELRNEEGETFDKLLARADAALYRAKSDGRNRACA